jgi:hypothetical protein
MSQSDAELEVALDQAKRTLDNQVTDLRSLQTKAGVALGFVLTSLSLMFSVGHSVVLTTPTSSVAVALPMSAAAVILAACFFSIRIRDVTNIDWLMGLVNDSSVTTAQLRTKLLANYWDAIKLNSAPLRNRHWYVDGGFAVFLIGVLIFVFIAVA